MLVLDTNILRRGPITQILRGRRTGDAPPAVSPVVVQELLGQLIREESEHRDELYAALEFVASGRVRILPEPEERIRSCFGLPPRLPGGHSQKWMELARLATQGLVPASLAKQWDAMAASREIGRSHTWLAEAKEETDFQVGMRDLVERQRALVWGPLWAAALPQGLTKADVRDLERVMHLISSIRSGMLRRWMLTQLAGGVGVVGVAESLAEKPQDEDRDRAFRELVEPHYLGGLELVVQLIEARWLPWVLKSATLPDQNDYFDLMILCSMPESEGIFVTKEQRWIDAARTIGLGHRVQHPDELLRVSQELPAPAPPFSAADLRRFLADPLMGAFPHPRLLKAGTVATWLRQALDDAAEAYDVADGASWWPQEQGQVTSVSLAMVMRVAKAMPGLQDGPLTLGAPRGPEKHIKEKRAILKKLWPTDGKEYRYSPYEVQVDFTVTCYDAPGNPIWFACESEAHAWHGTGAGLGTKSKVTPGRYDDYTWDFYKLLLVPARYRLFVGRVGAYGLHTESQRLDQLQEALATVMSKYGAGLVGDSELAVVLLPESEAAGTRGVKIGIWQGEGWKWSRPPQRPDKDRASASSMRDREESKIDE